MAMEAQTKAEAFLIQKRRANKVYVHPKHGDELDSVGEGGSRTGRAG
jgi:hypothetical protein